MPLETRSLLWPGSRPAFSSVLHLTIVRGSAAPTAYWTGVLVKRARTENSGGGYEGRASPSPETSAISSFFCAFFSEMSTHMSALTYAILVSV